MDSQKPKIALYAKRSFGEKLNATFDFIKENWKPLLKYTTYLLLPVCILQAACFNGFMNVIAMGAQGMADSTVGYMQSASFFLNYAGVLLFYSVGSLLLYSLVYALMQLYNKREERLAGITFRDLKPLLLHNVKRFIVAGIICIILVVIACLVMGVLAGMTYYTLWLTLPLFIAFVIPLMLLIPIYAFEPISGVAAVKKSYRLGFATWGGIFLVILVLGLIAGILQGFFSLPWYVLLFVKSMLTMSDGGAETSSLGVNFVQYLFAIVMLYGAYLSAGFTIIGMAYQYGHASEVVDSVTVADDIDNFDKL